MSMHSSEFVNDSSQASSPATSGAALSTKHKRVIAHEPSAVAGESVMALETMLRNDDPAQLLQSWQESPSSAPYREFSNRLRDELAPLDTLEEMLVDRVILSAWRMQTALRAEEIWTTHESTGQHLLVPERLRCKPLNDLRRDSKEAERGLQRAMKGLDTHRSMRAPQWGKPSKSDPREAPRQTFEPEPIPHVSSNLMGQPWSTDATNPDDGPAAPVTEVSTPRWQDRLVYDFNISESSPVVKGTWVTVNHLVSLIVDGWTWADILRSHPELSEDDIRTCLSFATEGEGMEV